MSCRCNIPHCPSWTLQILMTCELVIHQTLKRSQLDLHREKHINPDGACLVTRSLRKHSRCPMMATSDRRTPDNAVTTQVEEDSHYELT